MIGISRGKTLLLFCHGYDLRTESVLRLGCERRNWVAKDFSRLQKGVDEVLMQERHTCYRKEAVEFVAWHSGQCTNGGVLGAASIVDFWTSVTLS